MTTAQILKGARDAKGWTQRTLAEAIGVTSGFIAKVESGDGLPSYDVCVLLTNVLDVSLEDLWQSVEEAKRQAGDRRIRTRGALGAPGVRTRGAVRTRGEAPAARTTRGPAEIAQEIAGSAELLTAFLHLKKAFDDPTLRETALTTLKALAQLADARSGSTRGSGDR